MDSSKGKEVPMPHVNSLNQEWSSEIEQQILRAVKSIRDGSVEILTRDAQVVPIDRKEKISLDKSGATEREENCLTQQLSQGSRTTRGNEENVSVATDPGRADRTT